MVSVSKIWSAPVHWRTSVWKRSASMTTMSPSSFQRTELKAASSTILLLQHHSSKASIFWRSAFYIVQLSHLYMSTGKITDLTRQTFLGKVRALLFNMLSRFVIAFLRRSKCLNFMPEVTICSDFGTQNNKICHCLHGFPIYFPWSDRNRCHDLSFLLSFKPAFSLFSCPSSIGCLVLLHFLLLMWYHLLIWGCYFSQKSWFQFVLHPAWHFPWCTLHIS